MLTLVAAVVAVSATTLPFAASIRDRSQRNAAGCEALSRLEAKSETTFDETCRVTHVIETVDDRHRPVFVVFFGTDTSESRDDAATGHFEVFNASGLAAPVADRANFMSDGDLVVERVGAPALIFLSIPTEAATLGGEQPMQSVRVVSAADASKTVLEIAFGNPGHLMSDSLPQAEGPVQLIRCNDTCLQGLTVLEGRRTVWDWSWRVTQNNGVRLEVGVNGLLKAGKPVATFVWDDTTKKFRGPTGGARLGMIRVTSDEAFEQFAAERARLQTATAH